ncbi:helix-turn-helix domain-containing protein [Butyrivibrio sp. WCD2001]|uniref:helix-turn-helix domain-containing protein n=1 Tax=Butyrivibrio sp. WCD2001 TaxID=1280681 RepID=UPI00047BDD5C|nr:helix-turn-helix transcriptional regulator [Butyrivibrio sp. WCD2001]
MDIGTRIRYFREAKGYTVNKLANLCGISQSYLREIELGNKNPTVEILGIICDTLDISLRDFFDDSDKSKSSFFQDPLIESIYKLSSEQRILLKKFLDSLMNS